MKRGIVLPCLVMVVMFTVCMTAPSRKYKGLEEAESFVTIQGNRSVCVIDTRMYVDGEKVPTANPCESCLCRPPGFACAFAACARNVGGCREIIRKDRCCPEFDCTESDDLENATMININSNELERQAVVTTPIPDAETIIINGSDVIVVNGSGGGATTEAIPEDGSDLRDRVSSNATDAEITFVDDKLEHQTSSPELEIVHSETSSYAAKLNAITSTSILPLETESSLPTLRNNLAGQELTKLLIKKETSTLSVSQLERTSLTRKPVIQETQTEETMLKEQSTPSSEDVSISEAAIELLKDHPSTIASLQTTLSSRQPALEDANTVSLQGGISTETSKQSEDVQKYYQSTSQDEFTTISGTELKSSSALYDSQETSDYQINILSTLEPGQKPVEYSQIINKPANASQNENDSSTTVAHSDEVSTVSFQYNPTTQNIPLSDPSLPPLQTNADTEASTTHERNLEYSTPSSEFRLTDATSSGEKLLVSSTNPNEDISPLNDLLSSLPNDIQQTEEPVEQPSTISSHYEVTSAVAELSTPSQHVSLEPAADDSQTFILSTEHDTPSDETSNPPLEIVTKIFRSNEYASTIMTDAEVPNDAPNDLDHHFEIPLNSTQEERIDSATTQTNFEITEQPTKKEIHLTTEQVYDIIYSSTGVSFQESTGKPTIEINDTTNDIIPFLNESAISYSANFSDDQVANDSSIFYSETTSQDLSLHIEISTAQPGHEKEEIKTLDGITTIRYPTENEKLHSTSDDEISSTVNDVLITTASSNLEISSQKDSKETDVTHAQNEPTVLYSLLQSDITTLPSVSPVNYANLEITSSENPEIVTGEDGHSRAAEDVVSSTISYILGFISTIADEKANEIEEISTPATENLSTGYKQDQDITEKILTTVAIDSNATEKAYASESTTENYKHEDLTSPPSGSSNKEKVSPISKKPCTKRSHGKKKAKYITTVAPIMSTIGEELSTDGSVLSESPISNEVTMRDRSHDVTFPSSAPTHFSESSSIVSDGVSPILYFAGIAAATKQVEGEISLSTLSDSHSTSSFKLTDLITQTTPPATHVKHSNQKATTLEDNDQTGEKEYAESSTFTSRNIESSSAVTIESEAKQDNAEFITQTISSTVIHSLDVTNKGEEKPTENHSLATEASLRENTEYAQTTEHESLQSEFQISSESTPSKITPSEDNYFAK